MNNTVSVSAIDADSGKQKRIVLKVELIPSYPTTKNTFDRQCRLVVVDLPAILDDPAPFNDFHAQLSNRSQVLAESTYNLFYIDACDKDQAIKVETHEEFNAIILTTNAVASIKWLTFVVKQIETEEITNPGLWPRSSFPIVLHNRIICDHCSETIVGCRFKCMSCEDFDLCLRCHAKGLHYFHRMLASWTQIKNPDSVIRKDDDGPVKSNEHSNHDCQYQCTKNHDLSCEMCRSMSSLMMPMLIKHLSGSPRSVSILESPVASNNNSVQMKESMESINVEDEVNQDCVENPSEIEKDEEKSDDVIILDEIKEKRSDDVDWIVMDKEN